MSKSLSGNTDVDLTIASLSFIDMTTQTLTASTKITSADAQVTGNFELGSISDVEAEIGNKQATLSTGDGIDITNNEISFDGTISQDITTGITNTIQAGFLNYYEDVDGIATVKDVKTEINSKQDTITTGSLSIGDTNGLQTALNNKQDTITVSNGIQKSGNELSLTGTYAGSFTITGTDFKMWNDTRGGAGESDGRVFVHTGSGTKASSILRLNYNDDFGGGTQIDSIVSIGTTPNSSYDLNVNGNTNIGGVLSINGISDVKAEIEDKQDEITAGVGLTFTGNTLNFTGGDINSVGIRTGGDITLDDTNTLTVGSNATLDCNGNCDVAGDFTLNGDNVISVSNLTAKSITTISGNTRDYRTALQMGFTQKQYGIGIIDDSNDKLAIVVNPQVAVPNVLLEMDINGNIKILGTFHIGATNVGNTISTNTSNITTNATNITTNTTAISTINTTLSGYTYTSGTDTTKINNNFEIGSSSTSKTVSINGELIEDLINGLIPSATTYSALTNGGLAVNGSNEFSLDFTNLNAGISIPQDITMTSDADIDVNDGKTTLRDGGRQLLMVDFDKNSSSTGNWGSNSYLSSVVKQERIGDAFYYSNNPNNGTFKMITNGTYRISVKCSAENVNFGDRVCVGLYVSINGDTGAGRWRTHTQSGKFGMMYLRFDNYGFAGNMFFEDYYSLNANDVIAIKTKLGEGSDNRNWNDTQSDSSINLYTHMEIEKLSDSRQIIQSGNN